MRDLIVQRAAQQKHRAFTLDFLISCLAFAGYLRSFGKMSETLTFAISAGVRDASLRKHILDQLRIARAIPSATTLRRHRLTLHCAYCMCEQERNDTFLVDGCVRYCTVDSSPQGPYDYVMHGARTISSKDLVIAMHHANRLCDSTLGLGDRRTAASRLDTLLALSQGVPTAVGSGRQSLRRKVHAVVHSVRLSSSSWRAAAKILSSCVSWTGDLGVESGCWQFRQSLRKLFGEWVVQSGEDRGKEDNNEAQEPSQFYFETQAFGGVYASKGAVQPSFVFDDDGERGNSSSAFAFDDRETDMVGQRQAPNVVVDQVEVDFTRSVYIAGMLHVLHNTTRDLSDVLHHWPKFIPSLKQVCRLMTRKWSCDRLCQACFAESPQSVRVGDIKSFHASVYEGRWGSVWHAVGEALSVEVVLRFAWSKEKNLHGEFGAHHAGEDGQQEHSLNMDMVNDAILSPLFWMYAVMLYHLGVVFERMALWAEGCPCHASSPELLGLTARQRRRGLMQDVGQSSCPMRTMQAPACAAGEHVKFVHQLLDGAKTSLLLHPLMGGLSAEDKSLVMQDFTLGRQHIQLCLLTRLSFGDQLPWQLFGVAHANADVAARCAQRSLVLYAHAPEGTVHHWLTQQMCGHGSIGAEQMKLLASKARSLSELPFLESVAARLKFAPVSERWVESLHALTKRHMSNAPHVSATHVAFHGIQLPLRTMLMTRPESLRQLADFAESCRNPVARLKAMGLWMAPAVMRLRGRISYQLLNRHHAPALTEILYHVDAHTLHTPLPADDSDDDADAAETAAGPPPPGPGQQRPSASGGAGSSKDLPQPPPPAPPLVVSSPADARPAAAAMTREFVGSSVSAVSLLVGAKAWSVSSGGCLHDELWCNSALGFLRVWTRERALCTGGGRVWFSIGPKLSRSPSDYVIALSDLARPELDSTAPQSFRFVDDAPDQLEAIGKDLIHEHATENKPFVDKLTKMLFFTVQQQSPHRFVVPQKSRKLVDATCLAVNVHPLRPYERRDRKVRVLLESSGGRALESHILSSSWVSVDDFDTLCHWDSSAPLEFDFGFPISGAERQVLQRVTEKLLKARADTDAGKKFYLLTSAADPSGAELHCLQDLCMRGIVLKHSEDGQSSGWVLSPSGEARIVVSQCLGELRPVLRPRPDIALKDAIAFELAFFLRDQGWICSVKGAVQRSRARRSRLQPAPPPQPVDYCQGGELRWWIRPAQRAFQPNYMRALLMVQRKELEAIVPHFKPVRYYECLILGQPFVPRRRRPRFVMEGEEPPPRRQKARPARGARRPATIAPQLGRGEDWADSGDAGEGSAQSSEADLQSAASSSESSGSGAGSRASSSSSSDAADDFEQAEPLVDDAPDRVRRAREGGGGGGLVETTEIWRNFKFTEVKVGGQVVGLEAMCYIHKCKSRCTRTLRFTRHGGREATLRKLKWWALAGLDTCIVDHHVHMELPKTPDDLPALDVLEGLTELPHEDIARLVEVT